MTSVVELEQTCDWNVNLSCWWSSSELSNTELHRKLKSRKGPGSKFTDFMTTVFSSWNSKACHGQFVGNPRCWSSSGWSATTPWGSTSPLPSSRWLRCHLNPSDCFKMSESTSTPMWPLQSYSPISWGPEDRALILGAFFYGYVVFQVAAVDEKALTKIRCLGVEWPRCTEQRRCLDTGLAQKMWMDNIHPNS